MMKYVALLRGINVGGKNMVPMAELKQVFAALNFQNISTYINSGNVIFDTAATDILNLQQQCQAAILEHFQIEVPVAVISVTDLKAALAHAPAWWGVAPESKHNTIIVIPPVDPATIIAEVGAAKLEYERVFNYGQVIFWSAPLKTFSRTSWSKITAKTSYGAITIRNANTIKKLIALAE